MLGNDARIKQSDSIQLLPYICYIPRQCILAAMYGRGIGVTLYSVCYLVQVTPDDAII